MDRNEARAPRRGRDRSAAARRRFRPTLTALEGRMLLATFTVSNINNSGPDSLRAAVGLANSTAGADTITFSSLFDAPQTITLTAGELALTDPSGATTISGPGAALLSVSGNHASRVFKVYSGASAALSGLTITGGRADDGGG